jgi:PXPV repeat-containing protein
MKRLAAVAVLTVVLLPGVAFASSSTDAALGLGAFAVFNQILGGVGVFGAARPVVVAPAPVVVAPPPPVYVAPPAPVYYAPPPPVYYAPAPVYYAPAPVYYAPRPVVIYRSVPVHKHGRWGHYHR